MLTPPMPSTRGAFPDQGCAIERSTRLVNQPSPSKCSWDKTVFHAFFAFFRATPR